jgi:TonB family protein
MVREIRFHQPLIEKAGKLATASTDQFTFLRATLYRPGLVTLSDFRVNTSHLESSSGGRFNYELHIYGHAKSDTPFKKCFMVLEITAWKSSGVAFAEMPDLAAGENVELNLTFPLVDQLEGEGSYRLHLFADGIELLHSKLSAAYLAKQKNKTEELLAGKTQDWPPILAHKINPTYPESLKRSKVPGTARVRIHITKNGEVDSPELVSASAPAFGEAALAAVVKWKFDPALKARTFVDAKIEVPIVFSPPK